MKKQHKITLIAFFSFVLVLLILGGTYKGIMAINKFFNNNYLQFNQVVNVVFKQPIEIKKRQVKTAEIIRIMQTIPAPSDLDTDVEKYIYQVFGSENYRMAIAVGRCEGLNHPADGFNTNDNGSIDVGYMRINSINFKIHGCSLQEVTDPHKNIQCAYTIWDRADGKEGNKKGNFTPWVGFTNGCALTKYE